MSEYEEQSFIQKLFQARKASRPLNPVNAPSPIALVPDLVSENLGEATAMGLLNVTADQVLAATGLKRPQVQRFGGVDQVIDARWQTLQELRGKPGDPNYDPAFFTRLGLDGTKEDFARQFKEYADASGIKLGRYSFRYRPIDVVLHPVRTVTNLTKDVASQYAWNKLDDWFKEKTTSPVDPLALAKADSDLKGFLGDSRIAQIDNKLKRTNLSAIERADLMAIKTTLMRHVNLRDSAGNFIAGRAIERAANNMVVRSGLYKWLRFAWGPPDLTTHAFGGSGSGRLSHVLSMAKNPIGYTFRHYIWGVRGRSVPGLNLRGKIFGLPVIKYFQKGLIIGSFALAFNIAKLPLKALNWLVGKLSGGKINLATLGSQSLILAKKGLGALWKAGSQALVSAVGSLASAGMGAALGFASNLFKFALRLPVWPLLVAIASSFGIPLLILGLFILITAPFAAVGGTFGTSASAKPQDLAVNISGPSVDVLGGQTVSYQITVTANKEAKNFFVTIDLDNHFESSLSASSDCSVSGLSIRCPATFYQLGSSQTVSFSLTAKTVSSMTKETIALIKVVASSSTAAGTTVNFYLNAGGAPVATGAPYGWPVTGTIAPDYFGTGIALHSDFDKDHPITYGGTAVDINGNNGNRVCATMDGVVLAPRNDAYGVYVRGTTGYFTRYVHMVNVQVSVGDQVRRGQYLGNVDTAGNATGPHLHYSIGLPGEVGPGFLYYQYVPSAGILGSDGRVINGGVISVAVSC